MFPSEWGRELQVSELRENTVVIVAKEAVNVAMTMWCVFIMDEFIAFAMLDAGMGFIATREGESITDDAGSKLHVYEFLGVERPNAKAEN